MATSLTLSTIALTAIDQIFPSLDHMLAKGEAWARGRKIDDSVCLNWRVSPDMLPFSFQVQIATELPARALSRLAGAPVPSYPNKETSFVELRARVAAVHALIRELPAAAIDANPQADIVVPVGPRQRTFTRHHLVQQFILPNLYFHVTAAYLILRQMGVDVGKMDYLAAGKTD